MAEKKKRLGRGLGSLIGNVQQVTEASAEEIAAGIKQVLDELQKRLPETKILLLDIFPRGRKPKYDKAHLNNLKVNKIIRQFADGKKIISKDLSKIFLLEDGSLNMSLMKDPVHPNEAGYKVWAEAQEELVKQYLGE